MIRLRNVAPNTIVYQRAKSVRMGPSAVEVEVLEVHADYALVRKGKDQPPTRMYRSEFERLHKTPFPAPGGGRIATSFGGPSTIKAKREMDAAQRKLKGELR
jgi:hypothetical protein